jgi:hypothetical protein
LVVDQGLKRQLETVIGQATQKTEFCRDLRNRRFAHLDLMLATDDVKAVPLQTAGKEKVNAALEALAEVLNAIERHYCSGGCDFAAIAAHTGVGHFSSFWDLG